MRMASRFGYKVFEWMSAKDEAMVDEKVRGTSSALGRKALSAARPAGTRSRLATAY